MTRVGKKFPDIEVDVVDYTGEIRQMNLLNEAITKNKKILLFWYPKDFTFVCPTELHAFQKETAEFAKRNTILVAASCDTPEVHMAWLETPVDEGGIQGVKYPIIADTTRNLSGILGILDVHDDEYSDKLEAYIKKGSNVTFRATYLIDEKGVVFHEGVNHMPLGRNVQDYLRVIDAYAHYQKNGEVCPANWHEGEKAMTGDRKGVAEYQATELRDLYKKFM